MTRAYNTHIYLDNYVLPCQYSCNSGGHDGRPGDGHEDHFRVITHHTFSDGGTRGREMGAMDTVAEAVQKAQGAPQQQQAPTALQKAK